MMKSAVIMKLLYAVYTLIQINVIMYVKHCHYNHMYILTNIQ